MKLDSNFMREAQTKRILKTPKYYSPTVITDGGRRISGYDFETNDCTVIALTLATGMDYIDAHRELELAGRKNGEGFPFMRYADKHFSRLEIKMETTMRLSDGRDCGVTIHNRTTIGRFLKEHPKGNFILNVPRHVCAVIDGFCYDQKNYGKRTTVTRAWRIN